MANADKDRGRSIAQWFCLIFGITLIIAGLLGFLVEPKFDTSMGGDPGQIDGENLILFEVNGWHNVVHLLSGIFLLALSGKRKTARTAALAFGVVYVIVSVIGLIDGQDLFGLVPINKADNVLHIVLALTAIAAGLLSRGDDDDRDRDGRRGAAAGASRGRDHDSDHAGAGAGSGRGSAGSEHDRVSRDLERSGFDNEPKAGGMSERLEERWKDEPRGKA